MDRERLTELLQDPTQVAARDLGDLRSMAERFPWFSGAHLWLAVGEHAQGDVLSNDPARIPAAYLPSRAVLFDLTQAEAVPVPPPMHVVKDLQPETPVPTPQPVATPAAVDALPSIIEGPPFIAEETRPILPAIPIEDEAPLPVAAPVMEHPWAPPVHEEALPPVIEEPAAVAEELRPILPDNTIGSTDDVASLPPAPPAPSPSSTGPDPLESQIREAIMASGYDLSRIPTPPPAEPMEPIVVPPVSIDLAPPLPAPAELEIPEIPPVQPVVRITATSRLRFTDWLTTSDEMPPEPEGTRDPGLSAAELPSASGPHPIASLVSEALPEPKEIIERFIQQTLPTAAPVKAEFFTPQQAAKRSLQDEGLVSETLAKIYEQQGDIAKAKATYARLSIIHPEKSVYFAALSKALEGRSNK